MWTRLHCGANSPSTWSSDCSTRVTFRRLGPDELHTYVESGEPLDKAGAYGIQGNAAAFVKKIDGSYTNVVGLPLAEVVEALG
jgi:septum formation protein